jgi:hypothetical protein
VDDIICMTAATVAVTLTRLFTECLCYVLGRLHSSYVVSTRIGLQRIELINKTLVKVLLSNFLHIYVKSHNSEILAFKVIRIRIYST